MLNGNFKFRSMRLPAGKAARGRCRSSALGRVLSTELIWIADFLSRQRSAFLTSFAYTLYALRTGKFMPGRINFIAILLGFAFQTAFLYLRGKAEGSCPLNSLFDVLIFQSWSLVLTYLLLGRPTGFRCWVRLALR